MTRLHDLMHQASRIQDYRDTISSALYQIHRILTTNFPDIKTKSVEDMSRILSGDFQDQIIDVVKDIHHSVYKD